MKNFNYIGISGIMGCGKTTLTRFLSEKLNWVNISESHIGIDYIHDFFRDPYRWALETQLAFLTDKAINIISESQKRQNLIIDRIIDEDINIFAKKFFDDGYIGKKSYILYKKISSFFLKQIPKPIFIIYITCNIKTVYKRLKKRDNLTDNHLIMRELKNFEKRYSDWISHNNNKIYTMDSDDFDFRDKEIQNIIYMDIKKILNSPNYKTLHTNICNLITKD